MRIQYDRGRDDWEDKCRACWEWDGRDECLCWKCGLHGEVSRVRLYGEAGGLRYMGAERAGMSNLNVCLGNVILRGNVLRVHLHRGCRGYNYLSPGHDYHMREGRRRTMKFISHVGQMIDSYIAESINVFPLAED